MYYVTQCEGTVGVRLMEHNVRPSAIRLRDCALMQYYTKYTHCSNLTGVNQVTVHVLYAVVSHTLL